MYDKGIRFLESCSQKHKRAITAFAVAGVLGATCFSIATPAKATEDTKTNSVYNLHQKPLYDGEYAFDVIKSKITWADFTEYGENLKVVKNRKGKEKKVLQIGSTLTLEPIPGYKLKAEVIDLKPYLASDYYKSRIDADPNASDADKASYKPDQNNFCHEIIGGKDTGRNLPTSMALDRQGRYSHLGKNGIKGPGNCTLGSLNDGDNVGVTFKFTATYQGHDVDPKVIVTDGEECTDNGREWTAFITNGSPWEFVANIGDQKSSDPVIISEKNYSKNGPIDISPFAKYYIAPNENGGLGTQFFGGFSNMISHNHATPLVMTRYADQVSLYVNSKGMQASMFGFIFDEEGDAPATYGTAAHFIKDGNPYLGTVEPDYDFGLPGDDWVRDDVNGGDEGEEQLVGKGNTYNLVVGEDTSYSLDILASRGTNENPCADGPWVTAWVDFNNNGKFDEFEACEPVEVTGENQKVTLKFTNPEIKQITDVNIDKIGARVRIAFDKREIAHPTGHASTGEVEDFQVRVTHAPRGDFKTTEGIQGQPQTAVFKGEDGFFAYGNEDKDQTKPNHILADAKNPIRIVTPEGKLVREYKVDGQGSYTVSDTGEVKFTPEPGFKGKTTGVCLRAADDNLRTTGWTADEEDLNNNQGSDAGYLICGKKTMDAVYQPVVTAVVPSADSVTSTGIQGQTQTGKPSFTPGNKNVPIDISASNPAYFVDGDGTKIDGTTIDATKDGKVVGTYTIDGATGVVVFQPNPDFVGVADPCCVGAQDANGTQAQATYTPEVTPVIPTAEPAQSKGIQGAIQTGTPTFTGGDKDVPVKLSQKNPAYFVDSDGNKIDGTTIDAMKDGKKVGVFEIDPQTATVTFTPDKSFVGICDPCYVGAKDVNGTEAVTSYTPEVTPVIPSATGVETTDIQGLPQHGTIKFEAGAEKVPLEISQSNPAYFIDGDGNKIDATTIDAQSHGKTIGTYEVNPATAEVTFIPNKDFTGTPDSVGVAACDANGTQAHSFYQPHVLPVTPKALPAISSGLQGQSQQGLVKFVEGDPSAPIKVSENNPSYFTDANGFAIEGTTIDAMKDGKKVGTYTLDPATANVVFQPNPDFVGTPDSVYVGAKDANGTQAQTTYTPEVRAVTPVGTPAKSRGLQGLPQDGKPEFKGGDPSVPVKISSDNPSYFVDKDGNPSDLNTVEATLDGKAVGTYSINGATGIVTFQPNPDFVGVADPVWVGAKDINGTQTTTTYTPEVVGVVPVATPATSKGLQGLAQNGVPQFKGGDVSVPVIINKDNPVYFVDKNGSKLDADTTDAFKDGRKVGIYTIDGARGVVVFQPNPDFVGVADPVRIGAMDVNGTQAQTTYTPEVIPVNPLAIPAQSSGIQGATQTGTPEFVGGNEKVPVKLSHQNPAYFVDKNGDKVDATSIDALKDGKKVGIYKIDTETAKVTFTPNPTFVGTPDPAKVGAKDANGTEVTTYYSPRVTPVVPRAVAATSTGLQGQTQAGTPEFEAGDPSVPIEISSENPLYFVDGDGNKIDSTVVDAMKNGKKVGVYEIDSEAGKVTFTPNPDFVGTPDPAKVGAKDANGTEVVTFYTPTVTPVVPSSIPGTSEAPQGEPQTGTCQFVPGDPSVPVVIGPDNPAYFVDGDGNKIDETTIDAKKDGKKIGTYSIDPNTGIVTFLPDQGFVGTPDPARIGTKDANGTEVVGIYTPTSTPGEAIAPKQPKKNGPETSDPTKAGIVSVMAMASGLVMGLATKLRKKNNR